MTSEVTTDWSLPKSMEGVTVEVDDDDPRLFGPDGGEVDTWRHDHPYDQRMSRSDPVEWGDADRTARSQRPCLQ